MTVGIDEGWNERPAFEINTLRLLIGECQDIRLHPDGKDAAITDRDRFGHAIAFIHG